MLALEILSTPTVGRWEVAAGRRRHIDWVREFNTALNNADCEQGNAAHHAARVGNVEVFQWVWDRIQDRNAVNQEGLMARQIAAECKNSGVLAYIDQSDRGEVTPAEEPAVPPQAEPHPNEMARLMAEDQQQLQAQQEQPGQGAEGLGAGQEVVKLDSSSETDA